MTGYTLREMAISDYEAVHALWMKTEGMGLGSSDSREAIALFLERNPHLSLVACNPSGAIIGAVLCGHDGRRGYLHHLAVEKNMRRNGLGRALVNACLEKLATLRIRKCNLFLFAHHHEGRTFWLHQGWTAREDIVLIQKEIKLASDADNCGC